MRRCKLASLTVAAAIGLSCFGAGAVMADAKLKVGDKAPPLSVSTWLQGPEVNSFEAGRVYVVEFWATWCGPCRQIMPHMGDLQDEYREKGVTFIGFTSEANDKEEKVKPFVAKQGPKLGYSFAFGNGTETHEAYMKASGQNGIPCSFVVDRQGKIAYIGHPLFLDVVLPKVLDGSWDPRAGTEMLAAADKDFDAAYAVVMTKTKGPDESLKALAQFASKWPTLADNVYMNQAKLGQLLRGKKFPEAKELANKLIARAVRRGDTSGLKLISTALRDTAIKGQADLTAQGIKASEASYELDKESVATILNLLEAYEFAGDQAKVKELGPKAVAAAAAAIEGDNDAIGTLTLASAYFASGDKEQAKATAEKATKMAKAGNPSLLHYVEEQSKKFGVQPAKHEAKDEK